jgi:hypothetical protein
MGSKHALPPVSVAIPPDVKADAEQILTEIAGHLRKVLAALQPGEAAPRDLERHLGLHKTLCWRVLKVAYARDPLAAAPYLPGHEGLEKFLRAAAKFGVARGLLEPVRPSAERYHAMVKANAGDRASFEVMLLSLATETDSALELKVARRAGYRSSSYMWGVQTAVRILSVIITPGADGLVDLATVRGHVRARRLRKEGVLRLSRTIEHDTDAPERRRTAALAIEPQHMVGGVPLLPQFCSQPLPRLQAVELPGQNVEYCFADQAVGEQAAVTVFTGEVRRGLAGARYRTAGNSSNAIMMTARDPLGLAVIDLWAPPEFGLDHKALTVSAIGVDPLTQKPEQWHILPASASVQRMGRGLPAARLGEAPEYEGAVAHCFGALGWEPGNYELHRLTVEYPVLGSCLVLQTLLPEKPGRA